MQGEAPQKGALSKESLVMLESVSIREGCGGTQS